MLHGSQLCTAAAAGRATNNVSPRIDANCRRSFRWWVDSPAHEISCLSRSRSRTGWLKEAPRTMTTKGERESSTIVLDGRRSWIFLSNECNYAYRIYVSLRGEWFMLIYAVDAKIWRDLAFHSWRTGLFHSWLEGQINKKGRSSGFSYLIRTDRPSLELRYVSKSVRNSS